ncbi:MAG: hypothetical protein JO210_09250 [Acidobacteriaceae bacterium]|nr:hypothetical protein [Acidobacteriaceae bacterium]
MDTRIQACVLAGGGDLDGPDGYWDRSDKMCQGIPYRSLMFLGKGGPIVYALNAKRGPTLVINGNDDEVVDIPHHGKDWFAELHEQTVELIGNSKGVFDFEFVTEGGHRPYFVTKAVALWLEEKLKFPNWTRKQIETMPETNIGAWADKNGVLAGSGNSRAHNEGGTAALGDNIPAVNRDSLHALPEVVWDAEYTDYIYETWVERAQVAVRSGAP